MHAEDVINFQAVALFDLVDQLIWVILFDA